MAEDGEKVLLRVYDLRFVRDTDSSMFVCCCMLHPTQGAVHMLPLVCAVTAIKLLHIIMSYLQNVVARGWRASSHPCCLGGR